MKNSRRILFLALTVALAIMLVTGIVSTLAGTSSTGELIRNGDFENGFRVVDGCGMVGVDWGCFTTGGAGGYGFYDDQWAPVVATGNHAQLIEVNTKEKGGDTNRTAGIFQTVSVVPGATYTLSFNGMIRADDLASGGDPWRYVMLVGVAQNGSTNWADAQWQTVDVGPIQDRLNPDKYYHATVNVTAQSNVMTVFIAGRMKWGDWYREADFDIDTVSLVGATPPPPPTHTPTPVPPVVIVTPVPPTPVPPVTELVCDGPNVLANGGFEDGFDADGTAIHWTPYNNGGLANYGYYDDQWAPVVADGAHAQLLEINSRGYEPTDENRWIGIDQRVSNLTAGATYQLSLKAMIREAARHMDDDKWRYQVYWGMKNNGGQITNVSELESLNGIPVSDIYLRTAPGPYTSYSTTFTAPSSDVRLYLLGQKKWANPEREVNFDFDSVELRLCREVTVVPVPYDDPPANSSVPQPPAVVVNPPAEDTTADDTVAADTGKSDETTAQLPAGSVCTYVVQPGDYISRIAEQSGTTVEVLVELNDIANPKLLFVGQPLLVPCGGESATIPAEPEQPAQASVTAPEQSAQNVHVVKRGETLSQIAFRYGTTVKVLRQLNHIRNPRLIRPGQRIVLPMTSS